MRIKQRGKFGNEFGMRNTLGRRVQQQHVIGAAQLRTSEQFTGMAPGPITIDGARLHLLSNHEPEPGRSRLRGQHDQLEIASALAFAELEDEIELNPAQQARRLRKAGASAQGVRRARPLARRRESTLRPLRVAIRARNPWSRARLILLGWYVRFIGCRGFGESQQFRPARTAELSQRAADQSSKSHPIDVNHGRARWSLHATQCRDSSQGFRSLSGIGRAK